MPYVIYLDLCISALPVYVARGPAWPRVADVRVSATLRRTDREHRIL